MPRLITPFASGSVLDPEQGGSGTDLQDMPLGSVLMGNGDLPVIGTLIAGSGVGIDVTVPGQITISITATSPRTSVKLATAAALAANTYANGTAGVGATLTANANGALSIDGVLTVVGNRVLIKNEVAQANNGIYTVTAVGAGGAPYVLTRATDANSSSNIILGMYTFADDGDTNEGKSFVLTTLGTIVVGTTALTFVNNSVVDTATNLAGGVAGSVPYQSGVGTTTFLAPGNLGDILIGDGAGAIAWLPGASVAGTINIGYLNVPPNEKSADYTTVLTDSGKSIDHPVGDNNARTFTIDSNANVAYPIGTCLSFSNMAAAALSIAITADTMNLAGAGTAGTRTLAQYGTATARKQTATSWLISGVNLT